MTVEEAFKALTDMSEIKSIEFARLEPGDVIVISSSDLISSVASQRIKDVVESVWPDRKVMVLDRSFTMKVIRA